MDNYPLLNLFLTMLYLFLWIAWIVLLFRIVVDLFRSRDLSGGAKAAWAIFLVVVPWVGALCYLVVRGGSMHERDAQVAEEQRRAVAAWINQAPTPTGGPGVSTRSTADELTRLAELHRDGVLTDDEFAQQKAKALA